MDMPGSKLSQADNTNDCQRTVADEPLSFLGLVETSPNSRLPAYYTTYAQHTLNENTKKYNIRTKFVNFTS
jgi:predicted component of type VI protein secretion system